MNLAQQIQNLLYDYDCVIVPGLGGFIGNYSSAKTDDLRHRFHPPRKEISFNQQLVNNDGLLINSIAQSEGIPYTEAAEQTEQQVRQWHLQLERKAHVKIAEVGILHIDDNGKLRFEPDLSVNYARSSFGLPVLTVAPRSVIKTPPQEQIQPKEVSVTPTVAKVEAKAESEETKVVPIQKETSGNRWIRYAAILLPFLLYIGVVGSRVDLNNFQASDLNPFADKICAAYQPRLAMPMEGSTLLTWEENQAAVTQDKEFIRVGLTDSEQPTLVVRLKEKTTAARINTQVVISPPDLRLKFHVVGGCFTELENAHKLVGKLQQQGYEAHILDQHKGLWRVAFNSFATREEALQGLDRARTEVEKGAWLLIK